ncbi:hypothetical protein Syun_011998 [Stephania yunnanensis]|uniref:Uncharacterized protein n=1 Tax=Stephania yunnanensis TaxID=152371 RepID=A0AAP0PEV5_9MAGN
MKCRDNLSTLDSATSLTNRCLRRLPEKESRTGLQEPKSSFSSDGEFVVWIFRRDSGHDDNDEHANDKAHSDAKEPPQEEAIASALSILYEVGLGLILLDGLMRKGHRTMRVLKSVRDECRSKYHFWGLTPEPDLVRLVLGIKPHFFLMTPLFLPLLMFVLYHFIFLSIGVGFGLTPRRVWAEETIPLPFLTSDNPAS